MNSRMQKVNHETKQFYMSNCDIEIKAIDETSKGGSIEGYANIYNILDLANDIVRHGTFAKSIAEKVPKRYVPFLDHHIPYSSHVLGTVVKASEDSKGLFFKAELSAARSVQDIKTKVAEGHIRDLSVGFAVVNADWIRQGNRLVRSVTEAVLNEISLAVKGVNQFSKVTDVKAGYHFSDIKIAPLETKWDETKALENVRIFYNVKDIPTFKYGNAFMVKDRDNLDEFKAYQLPYTDIIDGQLMVIPNAVKSISNNILDGNTTGLTELELNEVKSHVTNYYKKMGIATPFSEIKSCRPLETEYRLRELQLREIELDLNY